MATVCIRISDKVEITPASEVDIMPQVEGHQELSGTWLLEESIRKQLWPARWCELLLAEDQLDW